MKSVLLGLFLLFNSQTFAAVAPKFDTITCTQGNQKVVIAKPTIDGKGSGEVAMPYFTLFEDNQVVGNDINTFTKTEEGYEGTMLNAYIWTFEGSEGNIGIAVPGPEDLLTKPGTYAAKADLFLSSGSASMDGSTVDCVVVIE